MDDWIQARYQGIVDLSQRSGSWWLEHCAILHALSGGFCTGWEIEGSIVPLWVAGLGLLVDLSFSAAFLAAARSDLYKPYIYMRPPVRLLLTFITSLIILSMIMSSSLSLFEMLIKISYHMSFLSAYYFVTCRPPKPRKKRETFNKQVYT